MRLRHLELQNCMSFRGRHELTFPEHGLVRVESLNHDTGGYSGGGKSSLFNGISTALGICPSPKTELQNWDTEDPFQVVLVTGAGTFGAGKKNFLKVGQETITGATEIDRRRLSLIGVSDDMLRALTFAPQDDRTDFLSLTNAEKQEFLSILLNLRVFEDAVAASQENLRALEKKRLNAEAQVEAYVRMLAEAKQKLDQLIIPVSLSADVNGIKLQRASRDATRCVTQERLDETESKIQTLKETRAHRSLVAPPELETELERLRAEERSALQAFAQVQAPEPSDELKRQNQIAQVGKQKLEEARAADAKRERDILLARSSVQAEITQRNQQAQRLPRLKTQLEDFRTKRFAFQETVKCQECGAAVIANPAMLESYNDSIDGHSAEIAGIERQLNDLPELQTRLNALVFTPDPVISKISKIIFDAELAAATEAGRLSASTRQVQDDLKKKYEDLGRQAAAVTERVKLWQQEQTKTLTAEIAAAEVEVIALKALVQQTTDEIARIDRTLNTIETERRTWEAQRQAHEAQVTKFETGLVAAKSDLNSVNAQIATEKDFARLVGREGFMGVIFDEVLTEISAATNAILGQVPNTQHVSLIFISETLTQGKPEAGLGKVHREIKPLIMVGGHMATWRTGLSGGMKSAVRLAVRLAIRQVIQQRMGICLNWLILDEPFNGLSSVERESSLEILRKAAEDNLILVVDHDATFKTLFDETITLEYRNGETTIKT